MSLIRRLFSKRKQIIPIPITPTEKELQDIIDKYYIRQKKKKKSFRELFGYMD